MAEISVSKSLAGVSKSKKLSTRVDLTPMVDLGFLLITFFIFTTTMAEHNAVRLNLPDDSTIDATKAPADKTLTLILDKDNQVFYYNGFQPATFQKTGYSPLGLRKIIVTSMDRVAKRFGDRAQTVVLIKPTTGATYQNVVDVLDEMMINGVSKYVLMDVNEAEGNVLLEGESAGLL